MSSHTFHEAPERARPRCVPHTQVLDRRDAEQTVSPSGVAFHESCLSGMSGFGIEGWRWIHMGDRLRDCPWLQLTHTALRENGAEVELGLSGCGSLGVVTHGGCFIAVCITNASQFHLGSILPQRCV